MKRKNKIEYFILLALWMGVIFYFSSQPAQVSSMNNNFIIKVLSEVGVNLTDLYGNDFSNFIIRKSAHITEYFILFILSYRALSQNQFSKPVLWGAVLSIFYSCTDEMHQLFVQGRAGRFMDVLIDSIGIAVGIAIIASLEILRRSTDVHKDFY